MSTTTQTHLMTLEEFMKIDDEPNRHELIKGELLTMPSPKPLHGRAVANLTMLLLQHVKANRPGVVYTDTDELVDDTVPGFRVKVSEIFN